MNETSPLFLVTKQQVLQVCLSYVCPNIDLSIASHSLVLNCMSNLCLIYPRSLAVMYFLFLFKWTMYFFVSWNIMIHYLAETNYLAFSQLPHDRMSSMWMQNTVLLYSSLIQWLQAIGHKWIISPQTHGLFLRFVSGLVCYTKGDVYVLTRIRKFLQ